MATEAIPVVDTPQHSSNTGEAIHLQGHGSVVLQSIHYFSKHDTIKLGYGLEGFVLGTVPVPSLLIIGNEDDVLVHLKTAKNSFEIWMTIEKRFGVKSNFKILSMCHALYSLKKTNLTIKEYLSKVKSLSDTLIAADSLVTEQEQVSIILAGLLIEYESIRVISSATPMSLDLLTDMLLDCEARQMALLTEVPLQANLASHQKHDTVDSLKHTANSNNYIQEFKQGHRGQGWL
ncbi:uncharacterized protein [Gossypium hirsutum]|uniref:Retrovirus-related Pol polyprotein from transposon TNT 1-94 n=1 Tax=Gossypium hirsutum TaxID=3635 RepID=A0A1U8PQ68_GOSHI|nr:uncharacterized protein LOC107961708 [Gossypium hirsutum]